jgi:hypothetical protein
MTTETMILPQSLSDARRTVEEIEKDISEAEHALGMAVVNHALASQNSDEIGEAKAANRAAEAQQRLDPARTRLRVARDVRNRLEVADERLRRDRRRSRYEALHKPAKVARSQLVEAEKRVVSTTQELVLASKAWVDAKADNAQLCDEFGDLAREFDGKSPSWPMLDFTRLQVTPDRSLANALLVLRGIRRGEGHGRSIPALKSIDDLAQRVVDATAPKGMKGKRGWRRK